jgi:hypothetical protein
VFLAPSAAVSMRASGDLALRLEGQGQEERHLRRADVRRVQHLTGA